MTKNTGEVLTCKYPEERIAMQIRCMQIYLEAYFVRLYVASESSQETQLPTGIDRRVRLVFNCQPDTA